MQKTLSVLLFCLAILTLTDCQKSAADISSGTYAGEKLTAFQDSMLFAKPGGATVTVSGIDGGTITVRMDSLITGFPSVTATCTAEKDGSGSDTKVTFSGEGTAGSSETIRVNGYTRNGRMSLNFTEVISSPIVRKWMLGESVKSGLVVPSIDFDIYFTPGIVTPEQIDSTVKFFLSTFLIERSPYYDNIELTSNGKLGINYKEYHAEAVLPRDSVDALWGQSLAGLGTIGDFVGTGSKGLIRYYQDGYDLGVSPPNTLIALLNALLKIYEIPFSVPVPFVVPLKAAGDASKLDVWIDNTVLSPILAEIQDTVTSFLYDFTYEEFLKRIPDEYKEAVKKFIPPADFVNYKIYLAFLFDILTDENSEYAMKLSFIPYEKRLRPWEE